jgi:hypothetical protein
LGVNLGEKRDLEKDLVRDLEKVPVKFGEKFGENAKKDRTGQRGEMGNTD